MTCPKCGNPEFKDVTENVQQKYKRCTNCSYSPALERAEPVDVKTWVEGITREHVEATENFKSAATACAEKETTLTVGKLNKAKRLLALSEKKMVIAEAVSTIAGETESGQITLLIPEIGLLQFEYGTFDLFKTIGGANAEG